MLAQAIAASHAYLRSVQKPLPPFRFGHHALILFAEPAIAVACYRLVDRIADELRDDLQKCDAAVNAAKNATDFNCCVTFRKGSFWSQEEHGGWGLRIEALFAIQLLSQFRLNGAKVNQTVRIALKHELHGLIAEIADAIKEKKVGPLEGGVVHEESSPDDETYHQSPR